MFLQADHRHPMPVVQPFGLSAVQVEPGHRRVRLQRGAQERGALVHGGPGQLEPRDIQSPQGDLHALLRGKAGKALGEEVQGVDPLFPRRNMRPQLVHQGRHIHPLPAPGGIERPARGAGLRQIAHQHSRRRRRAAGLSLPLVAKPLLVGAPPGPLSLCNSKKIRMYERIGPLHVGASVVVVMIFLILHHQGRNSKALTRYTAGVPPIFRCKNDHNSCFPLFPLISEKKMLPSGR